MKENMFRTLFAAALGALAAYAGVLLAPLCVLAVVMVLDYATGIAAAWSCKLLSSRVGVKGIVKKVAYLALVAVGMVVDYLISSALLRVGVDIQINYCFGMMISAQGDRTPQRRGRPPHKITEKSASAEEALFDFEGKLSAAPINSKEEPPGCRGTR